MTYVREAGQEADAASTSFVQNVEYGDQAGFMV